MRTKGDLLRECRALDAAVNGAMSKKELEMVLANIKRPANTVEQIEVMLARDFKDEEQTYREWVLEDHLWVAEPKLDGARMKLHVTENGIRIDGRRKSDKTYVYTERTENFPHIAKCTALSEYVGLVLDCELLMQSTSIDTGSVVTKGTLNSTVALVNCEPSKSIAIQAKFGKMSAVVFDVIRGPKGHTLAGVKFEARREFLVKLFEHVGQGLNEANIHLITQSTDKAGLYRQICNEGGEGVMLKHKHGYYEEGKRVKTLLKWKKTVTVDGFVTGYVPAEAGKGWEGLVGALEVSVIDEADGGVIHCIGAVQPGTLLFRKQITAEDGSLKREYYNKVVEVQGNEWTKNKRLFHCVLVRWRPDKNASDCMFDLASITPGMNTAIDESN